MTKQLIPFFPGSALSVVAAAVLSFCLVGGCSNASDSTDFSNEGTSVRQRTLNWKVNTGYVFSLRLKSEASLGTNRAISDFDLQGRLTLSLVSSDVDAESLTSEVLGNLYDLTISSRNPDAQATYTALEKELVSSFSCLYREGVNTGLRLLQGGSPAAASVIRTLCASLQLSLPSKSEQKWTALENDASGRYTAEYSRGNAANEFGKRKISYQADSLKDRYGMGLGVDMKVAVVQSEGTVKLKDRHLFEVSFKETLKSDMGNGTAIHSSTSLVIVFEKSDAASGKTAATRWEKLLADAQFIDAEKPYVKIARKDYSFDKEKIGDLTLDQAIAHIEQRGKHLASAQARADAEKSEALKADSRVFVALAALLRSDPGNVDKVVKMVLDGSLAPHALIDALGSAGSNESQAGLLRIAGEKRMPFDVRLKALQSLTWTHNASESTVRALLTLSKEEEIGDRTLLGMGTLTRRLSEEGKMELAQEVANHLISRLKVATTAPATVQSLRSIANSGFNGAFARVKPYLDSEDAQIKAAAIQSIRLMKLPEVNQIIAYHLRTANTAKLRLASVSAAETREPTKALTDGLHHILLTADDSVSRMQALRVAVDWYPQWPGLENTLAHVAEHDDNEGIRKVAAAALKRGKEQGQ